MGNRKIHTERRKNSNKVYEVELLCDSVRALRHESIKEFFANL